MNARKVVVALLAVLFLAAILARFLPTSVACRSTLAMYRFLNAMQIDDELPAVSLRFARVLFAPNDRPVHACVITEAIRAETQPNDLLIFAMASYASERMPNVESAKLFRQLIEPLRNGPCERMYLVAALLPLAASDPTRDMIHAYELTGRVASADESAEQRCQSYRQAIQRLLSRERAVRGATRTPAPSGDDPEPIATTR